MWKLIKREVKTSFHWFTGRAEGIVSELVTPVEVSASYLHERDGDESPVFSETLNALWDTGATTTVITPHVAKMCDLKPIGVLEIAVAGQLHRVNSYLVNVRLPNCVTIANLTTGCMELPGNIDLLIGMDIITLGDFAITNAGSRTVISFRIPSLVRIDFGRSDSPIETPHRIIGMDQPCPCGSGQTFRECCCQS